MVSASKTVLVIGHPGHELRVFHWLEITRPTVFVITDGSGHSGRSRVSSTSEVLKRSAARTGSFFGRLTDAEAYAAILNGDTNSFLAIARLLARHLVDEHPDYVAGDAMEGYNPTHDICRLIIDTAVEMANRVSDREIGNFEFPLTGPPDAENCDARSIHVNLDNEALERKVAAALSYAELKSEVEDAFKETQIEGFRRECLRPSRQTGNGAGLSDKPFYEQHGEKQVAAGHYSDVIRYREHFLPLIEAFRQEANKGL